MTGMPASAGAATALVMPGTTSNGTPAALAAPCASSPPRPNTNGSPPFSRTTRRPRRAARIISAWIASCVIAWRPARLPTKKRCARRASRSTRVVDQRVVQHQVGRAQSRHRFARQQPRIARTRTDERHAATRSQPRILRSARPRHANGGRLVGDRFVRDPASGRESPSRRDSACRADPVLRRDPAFRQDSVAPCDRWATPLAGRVSSRAESLAVAGQEVSPAVQIVERVEQQRPAFPHRDRSRRHI